MSNQEAVDIQSAKITVIGNINMMDEIIGVPVSSFKLLNKYSLEALRELQDSTIKEYNRVIKNRS